MNLENENAVAAADEDFNAAFAKFAKAEEAPAGGETTPVEGGGDNAEPAASSEPAPAAEPAATGGAAEAPAPEATPAAEPAAEAGGETVPAAAEPAADAGTPAPAAEPAPVKAPSADDILTRLDEIVSKSAPAPATAEPAKAETQPEPELYTADEQKFLEDYQKDWSDVARGEALRRRAENAALVEFIFTEIAKSIVPLRDMTMSVATRTHAADLEQKIGKYDDSLRDEVEVWIGTQPDYLQATYKQVIDEGTSDQVADLIGRFRKETGSVTPASPPTETKGGTELSTPAKQAAEAMAPVETKRTVIEQQDDPNDYKAAFARFAKELEAKV